jgi:hypothetical protein
MKSAKKREGVRRQETGVRRIKAVLDKVLCFYWKLNFGVVKLRRTPDGGIQDEAAQTA